jgi:hypothetical protein
MDIEQLADPTHNKKKSDRKPESLQFQGEVLPRCLCSEGDDAHPNETRAPANVPKQGYPHPDEKQAPPGCFKLSIQGTPIHRHLIMIAVCHEPPPYFF